MRYIEEFRNGLVAQRYAKLMQETVLAGKKYQFMEFCGGHTHALHRYGIPSLLPSNVEMIHGPGCPVCVLPIARIDQAIALAKQPQTILCSYGDMLRVPGSEQMSLLKVKAQGADIRMVYSVSDAVTLAQRNPQKKVIFFAIGFETTTPPTAHAILQADQLQLKNFFVFCNHVLTPVAMECILNNNDTTPIELDGFVGPAHVSIVIGSNAYADIATRYQKPIVISGFEPLDLMQSIQMLIELSNAKSHGIFNQYTRAVCAEGNIKSQAIIDEVLELRDSFEWRGLGAMPHSALKIRTKYQQFDAEQQFELASSSGSEHKACECGAILRGIKKPLDCKLFDTVCTPENPLGACMVSSEGACAAVYAYGRLEH